MVLEEFINRTGTLIIVDTVSFGSHWMPEITEMACFGSHGPKGEENK